MSVTLHHPTKDDEFEWRSAVSASHELHHPWVHFDDSHEGFMAYLRRSQREDMLLYLLREDERLIGFINVNNIVRGALHSGYLGYGAFSGGEGRGRMTIGLSLVIDDLFQRHELHRAEANIQPQNSRSIALVTRLGFVKEGFSPRYLFIDNAWKDHERWAILSEDWNSKSQ